LHEAEFFLQVLFADYELHLPFTPSNYPHAILLTTEFKSNIYI